MNTVKSFWLGWGALCVAGGGAYYFAKQSINADRQARFEADQRRRRVQDELEYAEALSAKSKHFGTKDKTPVNTDPAGSPGMEMSFMDPDNGAHAPCNEGQRVRETSKYEASEVYRQRKGDRFS